MKQLLFCISLLTSALCSAQVIFICGEKAVFLGRIKAVSEKDIIFKTEKINYYLFFDIPINMLNGNSIECDTAYGITKTTLLPEGDFSLAKFNDKLVTLTGRISLTPTMHYHTKTMIDNITYVALKTSIDTDGPLFYIGNKLTPSNNNFELLGISPATGVHTYRYLKKTSRRMFERQIGDIIIGIKDGYIVTTIYNLIPQINDIGVPTSIVELVQKELPYPLTLTNGSYGINIDNNTISLSRTKSIMTFNEDRIMFFSSIKNSLLQK